MHRSDGSGTTYIFSNYLSSVDPTWASKVGTGKTLNWPTGEGAEGNSSVATAVNRTPFSIGYIEQAYSQGLLLPFAAIRNQAGNYVTPSIQSVAADAAQKPSITPTDFSIVNQPGASSYPDQRVQLGAGLHPPAQTRPKARHWSPCWTGSPTTARPTPPPTATCPCQPRSSNSPAPCSSRSPAPQPHAFLS